ncbi:hypothetical protein niasHT_016959 [Heterodera trifolii]|uniref:Deacetylase sirtuin-type domain-containing protein n=1 Tax=Heterodera trifolii TaxID=157864 RepID=A0ABD2LB35_9BILA
MYMAKDKKLLTVDAQNYVPNLVADDLRMRELAEYGLDYAHSIDDVTTRPQQKLATLNLDGVATFIREKQPEIVFMVGAGVSTSAGIPDFRTPGTGLNDNLKQYDIPNSQAIFDINYFRWNPEPFFVLTKAHFHESIMPTPAHHFIRLVQEKGLLRRCYTQNIDGLEFRAGVEEEKVVAAHGSYRTSTCLSCEEKYNEQWLIAQMNAKVPRCVACQKGVVKPDIVFFGENLHSRFFSSASVDLPNCGLLIVMGTSLVVRPFASLVNQVPSGTPRLLINLEPARTDLLRYAEPGNIRDVFWQGKCDEGVERLAKMLGWEQEFEALLSSGRARTLFSPPHTLVSAVTNFWNQIDISAEWMQTHCKQGWAKLGLALEAKAEGDAQF